MKKKKRKQRSRQAKAVLKWNTSRHDKGIDEKVKVETEMQKAKTRISDERVKRRCWLMYDEWAKRTERAMKAGKISTLAEVRDCFDGFKRNIRQECEGHPKLQHWLAATLDMIDDAFVRVKQKVVERLAQQAPPLPRR